MGRIPNVNNGKPLVIVGGNCSIQGFDEEGDEKFWTVCGIRSPQSKERKMSWRAFEKVSDRFRT